jgi:nicotinamidase-related amidase
VKNSALLIVDVQVGAFNGFKIPPVKNADRLIKNIRTLIQVYRENNLPIVYIQDCGKVGGAFEQRTEHWQIHSAVSPNENDTVIQKKTANAFFETNLEEIINRLQVDTLIMSGLHSENCFSVTCSKALELGCQIVVVGDGHSTSKEQYSEVIERQNALLARSGASIKLVDGILTYGG